MPHSSLFLIFPLAIAPSASGQSVLDLLYVRSDVGASLVPDISLSDQAIVPAGFGISGLKVSADTGVAWTIEAGVELTDFLAVEVQSGYIRNSVDGIAGGQFTTAAFDPVPIVGGSGRFSQVPILANVLLRLPLTEAGSGLGALRLELGGGVGTVNVEGRVSAAAGPDPSLSLDGLTMSVDGSDWVFGYQGTVALLWDLTPNIDIGIRYRFMAADGAELGNVSYNIDPTGLLPTGSVKTDDVFTNAIQASLGIRF